MRLTDIVTLLNFQIQLESALKGIEKRDFYFAIFEDQNLFLRKSNQSFKKKKRKKKYNWVILFGFEESQETPVWTHKSFITFQFKFPFDVNEL